MPSTPIANFDAGRIPDVSDEANFHDDATYVFEHMASDIIPGINTNLDWMNAALDGSETLVDAVATLQVDVIGLQDFASQFPALDGEALKFLRANAAEDGAEFIDLAPHAQPDWDAGVSTTGRLIAPANHAAALRAQLNVSGLAPMFACRAWVNFNGTGTVAIRASGNVSSITDNGTGDYTVNFTAAMPDADYAVAGIGTRASVNPQNGLTIAPRESDIRTDLAYQIRTSRNSNSADEYQDQPFVNIAFFR